jgi:hypothetical protein
VPALGEELAMTLRAKRRDTLVMVFVAAAAVGLGAGRAEAQWGFGMGGMGWGFGGFSQVPKPESFLYQKALVDAGRGSQFPSSREVYANNPNSYINHIRDNGLVERYDVARREPSHYRRYVGPRTTPTAMTVAQQTPVLPLASFYNRENHFVWPGDAPAEGDLKEKRAMFDQASQTVLTETKKSGVASIAVVTDARQKLLDYGRPALQYVRTHDTLRVADSFHLFLLSTYESLAQAVNPPPAGTPTQPAPPTS